MDFSKIKVPVARRFAAMTEHDMFRADVSGDELWNTYLASFPAGTNPVLRTEHDCSCCRQFVRAVGNAVAVVDGRMVSVWDIESDEPAYQVVADALSALVKAAPLSGPFLHSERVAGTDKNFQDDAGVVKTWEHFHVTIPQGRNRGRNYYCAGPDIATRLGEARAAHDVLLRSLTELTIPATDTVLELIGQNSLYRGNEYEAVVKGFRKLKAAFDRLPEAERDTFAWVQSGIVSGSVAKIRNTAIGTLLVDLSNDLDIEDAVRKFEAMVAPQNYKRPTALVTQAMVDRAKTTVAELGLTSAMERRYANLADISINDIVFADRQVRGALRDEVFDGIAAKPSVGKLDKVETVPIEKFISDIVPNVDTIEVLVENRHVANLVSLVAPIHADANPLFKWSNNFSWSYNGDMADSLKERVKRAGGNVTGDLCCRLAWRNFDDLDLHMIEPGGEIYFARKISAASGGQLDIDMNAGGGHTRTPVENIFYGDRRRMPDGAYQLLVRQYNRRESVDIGFEVEFDFLGDVRRYEYDRPMKSGERVGVVSFDYSKKDGIRITNELKSQPVSRTLWGLASGNFHRVNVLTLSPNYWGERGVGNKHYMFMLDGCVNDGVARGFFNEFLRPELDAHRKVIEIVGSRQKTRETPNQLSGLGFSDTRRDELTVRVKGNFTRTLKLAI